MKKKHSVAIPKKYLIFREDARKISVIIQNKNKKEKNKTFYLDFSKTSFFSRSFIDELLNMIGDFRKKKLIIKITNLKPQLEKFLKRVEKRKQNIKKETAF